MREFLRGCITSSTTGNPSTKRLAFLAAAIALILTLLEVGGACAWWIAHHGDLGAGAAGALLTVAGTVAALAGVGYRKPESAPSLGGPSAKTGGQP